MAPVVQVIAKTADLKPGTMKMVPVEAAQTQVLLVHGYDEKYYALGGKCSHYKGLMSSGVLSHTRIKCPLHGACFRLDSGQIEDFPGMDCISKYDLSVDKQTGNISIHAELEHLQKQIRTPQMIAPRAHNTATVVIVGGGPAALQCAESLRTFGFDGNIAMYSAEPYLPIDRPKLSKKPNCELSELYLRPKEYFDQHKIDIHVGSKAVDLDTTKKEITLETGNKKVHYDKLVIAVGTDARRFQDINADNLFYMRTHVDAQKIHAACKDKAVVIVGTSFIGMETAGTFVKACKSVTCIDINEVPFQLSFGKDIGLRVKTWFESNNIKFVSNASASEWKVENGTVKSVKLSTGQVLTGDVFIAGIGTTIPTKWLDKSGVKLIERTGAIVVDDQCRTNVPDVFAAGDCTSFPLENYDCNATIQHWQMAHHLGKIAASTICMRSETIGKITPFFWTVNFAKSMRYAGYSSVGYDDLKVIGSIEEMKFVVFYFKADRVLAAASLGMDPVVARYAELLTSGDRKITRADVEDDPDLSKTAIEVFTRLAQANVPK